MVGGRSLLLRSVYVEGISGEKGKLKFVMTWALVAQRDQWGAGM